MGKKREHMTVEQCKAQVEKEIPYAVGNGTNCVQRRTRRLKELYRRHGYDVSNAPGIMGVQSFNGNGCISGHRGVGIGGGGRTNTDSSDPIDVGHRYFKGQRVA